MARVMTDKKSFIEQARRDQIVAAAIDVLSTRGFAAASIGVIAEHVGVSKGVISYHFAGKNDLLREVVAHVLTEAGEYMRPRIAAADSSLDALRRYVTSNFEYIDAHRPKIMAFIEIMNGLPQGGTEPPPYEEGHWSAVESLQRLLESGQASGEFGDFSARVMAISVRASIDAVSTLLRAEPATGIRAYGAEVLRIYERAVAA
jgi:AcrR family transcriptional regulator